MTDVQIPAGFAKLDVTDDFVGLVGPLYYKAEGEKIRIGLPLEPRHGNPMGWAHGGLLVTVADMVMGVDEARQQRLFAITYNGRGRIGPAQIRKGPDRDDDSASLQHGAIVDLLHPMAVKRPGDDMLAAHDRS